MNTQAVEWFQGPENERLATEVYRALVEHSWQGWIILQDGRIIFANAATAEMSGYSVEELLALSPAQVEAMVHPQDQEQVWGAVTKRLAGEPAVDRREFRLQCKDGRVRWVQAMGRIMDYQGRPALQVALMDITEQKQAGEEIERRTRDLAALNAVAAAVSRSLDLEGVLAAALDAALQAIGFEAGGITLWKEQEQRLERVVTRGVDPRVGEAFLGRVRAGGNRERLLLHGEPIFHEDTSNDPGVNPAIKPVGFTLSAMVPLLHAGKVLGILAVATRARRSWSEEDKALLIAVGQQIGIAVANAHLYEETRQSEQRYRDLLNATTDLVFTIDREGNVLFANPSIKAFIGYEPEEVVGHHLSEYVHEEDLPFLLPRVQSTLNGEPVDTVRGIRPAIEFRLTRRDGGTIWVQTKAWLLRDAEGRIAGFGGIARDITERKRAEEERQVMLEILQGVATATDLQEFFPLIHRLIGRVIDAENFFVVLYNKRTGLFEEVFTVDQYDEPMPPSRLEKSLASYVYRTGQTVLVNQTQFDELLARGEVELVGANSASWLGTPLKTPDGILGVMAVQNYEDPNRYSERDKEFFASVASQVALAIERRWAEEERDRLREQFYQAQKMEAVGRLAGGVAHDFNNLLTIIQLSTRLMGQQLHPADPLHLQLQRIDEARQRAAELSRQLLTLSRHMPIQIQQMNLNEGIREMSRMLPRLLGEDIELVLSLSEDLWPVEINPTQFDQVLLNLAINARDAMPQGGRLRIETSNVLLNRSYTNQYFGLEPGDYVLLSVSDTGVGMSEEVKARIFEPFFTTKGPGQGSGLGLSTVYGIVRQWQGHISVESEVGQGTTFKLYLPRAAASIGSLPAGPAEATMTAVQGTETVLVVEDEVLVRQMVRDILTTHGYLVLTAQDGVEALQVAAEHEGPIHLLLTDVVMPRLGGRALAERLHLSRPETRLLYMSGYTGRSIAHHGVLEDSAHFLSKPFDVEELLQRVRDILDGRV